MRGWISIVAVSAVLSAGLVAGRAAADSITAAPPGPATWRDPPAKPALAAPGKTEAAGGPACTASAWAPLSSGCNAHGRPVRIIALTQR